MSEMLDRLGLDAAMLAHGRLAIGLRAAVCTCQSCVADRRCQDFLVRAPEWLDRAPDFCPNAALFACERDLMHGGIQEPAQKSAAAADAAGDVQRP